VKGLERRKMKSKIARNSARTSEVESPMDESKNCLISCGK
jgi:hypothetical protein